MCSHVSYQLESSCTGQGDSSGQLASAGAPGQWSGPGVWYGALPVAWKELAFYLLACSGPLVRTKVSDSRATSIVPQAACTPPRLITAESMGPPGLCFTEGEVKGLPS